MNWTLDDESDLSNYVDLLIDNNEIDPSLYAKYNVKRGLRNADGTGVLVGLTRVGDVHGYLMDEGERVPVEGQLFFRGIDVAELVKSAETERRFGYEETIYLLLFGDLPSAEAQRAFSELLGKKRALPDYFVEDIIMKAPSPDIMNKLARSVLACYAYDPRPEDLSPENVLRQCLYLIARFPTMVAYAYMAKKHYYDKESLFIHAPLAKSGTAESLLALIRPDQTFTALEAETLDLSLILHAEHGGGNNSTYAVHLVSSTDTDTYSAIAAGVGSLKGSKHGGANIKVNGMMQDIKTNVRDWRDDDEIASYLVKILKAEAYDHSGLVYGQGHAVYTLSDPRAKLLRDKAESLAVEKGFSEEFQLYRRIEDLMPMVFRQVKGLDKPICSNVDFYSGFVYRLLGIPHELFTPLFAVSRISGWCAHRLEEIISGGRIIRPAYKCVQARQAYQVPAER